jgi:uncharacterized protein (DUF2235 family)
VVCCDGTWDAPVASSAKTAACTNVYKLWRGLAESDDAGVEQRVFYHEGVGTGGRLDRLLGGGFGAGVAHNICDCYRFLVLNYEPGDTLYLLGFSRGAYTARSLAGMVRNCGILTPQNLGRVGQAFQLYRDRGEDTSPAGVKAEAFRRDYALETRIHFIGVWDTVGSLGVPIPIPFFRPWWAFHDSDLSSTVDNAFHAVAIDERRGPFKPTLWTRPGEPPRQTLEQVWFPGVHRDVGGGYPRPDLADITLCWMVDRAQTCGLSFDPAHFQRAANPDPKRRYEALVVDPNPIGELHTSQTGIWKVWGHRRKIPAGKKVSYKLSRQWMSDTAAARINHSRGYTIPAVSKYDDGSPVPSADVMRLL